MDNNNWRPPQGVSGGPVGDPSIEFGDWRAQLPADGRSRIVNKIMETLKRHLPFSGHEGLQELKKKAEQIEEKIYTATTSQSDYLRKLSLKMLTMETGSQNRMPDAMQANNGLNPLDPGFKGRPESDPSMKSGGWRVQLQPDSRERIVNKITETLKRSSPFPDQEALDELKGMAMRFEENIYTTATSQHDYLRTITLKMMTVETRSENSMPDAMETNNGINPLDPVSMATGHQTPSISDTAIDNVSSGGPEGDPSMESGDWRVQLQPDSRERIVNKIMETLKQHLPFSGHEELQELKKVAVRFEDNIYTIATSQSDYLRKISLKMLTMETRSQNPMPDAMQANNGLNPLDPGFKWQPEGGPSLESGDWRVQLQPDSRERIVNKIVHPKVLIMHLPYSGHEGLQELKGIAMRLEEKIYTTATSQSDYLRKISLKMLTMETRSQNPMPDAMQANNGLNPLDPGNVASGHQAPSISDMARDNVSQPSGGTHSYSRDQSAPSWNALYNRETSPMMIESDNAQKFTGDECGWNDMSEV